MRPVTPRAASSSLGVPALRYQARDQVEKPGPFFVALLASAEFWLGLQADYELDLARDQSEDQIAREVPVRQQVQAHPII